MKVTLFDVDESLSPQGQAAALTLVILRVLKAESWDSIAREPALLRSVYLNAEQVGLLNQYPHIVTAVSYRAPRKTIAICQECNEYIVACSTVPSGCAMTWGCKGKYRKIQPGKARKVDALELEENSAAPDDAHHSDVDPHDEEIVEFDL